MVIMKSFKQVLILNVLYNFSASQQKCRDYKNSYNEINNNEIYLLESNDPIHFEINENFTDNSGVSPQILETECQLKVEDIIEYSKQFPYLINLYVPDFYKNNYNKVRNSLVYAGDIDGIETKVEVCKSAKKREDGIETCKLFIETKNKYVKLVTTQIEEKYGEIFKDILKFQPFQPADNVSASQQTKLPTKKQLNVIVCDENSYSYYNDNFETKYLQICNDDNPSFLDSVKNDTLAVLAPNVFNVIRPIDNPVLFYGHPYITKETKDWFKNAISAVPWQSLKYGFLFLIKNMKWMRVAIISDSSEYSREFEAVLTTLFRENGISYMTETCVTLNCGKVINKINENNAKIIIANFDQENMKKIAPYTESKKRRARNLIWVTRDLRRTEAKEAADMLNYSEIFNIYFKIKTPYILQILRTIRYRINVNCIDEETCSFNKSIAAAKLKELLKTSEIMITGITNNQTIGSIVIENDKITKEHFNYPYSIEDSFISCIVRNNRFEKDCNDDIELVLLMVVLCVFFLTVLGVVLFFQSPEFKASYMRIR